MYRRIILPDGSTGFYREDSYNVPQPLQPSQPPQNQHNMTESPSSRQVVYVPQRFQSPQTMFEQQHSQIIEVPHNIHSHQFPAITFGSHSSQLLPQNTFTQMVPYNPVVNLKVSRFQGEHRSPLCRQERIDESLQKKVGYSNVRNKTRRELLAIENEFDLDNARDLYWKPITIYCMNQNTKDNLPSPEELAELVKNLILLTETIETFSKELLL